MVKVAVVGGGIFGCTIAVDLARAGAKVDLFEARADILTGATSRCQGRIHRGYHYPRSDTTAEAARDSFFRFIERYPAAIRRLNHYYAIAPESKTTPSDFLIFCKRLRLPYEVVEKPWQLHTAELCVKVPEAIVDMDLLRRLARSDLMRAGVAINLGQKVKALDSYDEVVFATYGQPWIEPLQYEICEVAIMELGRYNGESFVVLDGDFVSLDPYGKLYALYDVKHTVHNVNVGWAPEIPLGYEGLLARSGLIKTSVSRFDAMVQSAGRFLWGLDPGSQHTSIYHGSYYSVRAVLPNVDSTDRRPTLIQRHGNETRVLSGKICTSVTTAKQVTEMLVPA
jgi:hypothetical protein